MNPEIKVIIYEEKNILKNLLTLLDEQYDYIINKDVIKMDKIATSDAFDFFINTSFIL